MNSFANDAAGRQLQDVGLDGLSDAAERKHFAYYVNHVKNVVNKAAYDSIYNDPSRG